MAKEFNSESDIRNFRSKVLLLPRKLILQCEQIADDGGKEWRIENFIKQNYHGALGAPTPPTIKQWLLWREAKKRFQQEKGIVDTPSSTDIAILEKQEVQTITEEYRTILDSTTPVEDKKKLLELLIRKCIQRIKKVENLQEVEGVTASLEAVVGSYLREIHAITTTQLKLSGELQAEQNAIIGQMINRNMYQLITIVFQIIGSIVPERIEEIKTKIFEKLKESKELLDVLEPPPVPK